MSTYPPNLDERSNLLDQHDLGDRLHEVDERFYSLETETDADAWLNAHLDAN